MWKVLLDEQPLSHTLEQEKSAVLGLLIPAGTGYMGAREGQRKLRAAGMSEDAADVDAGSAAMGSLGRATGYGTGAALATYLAARGLMSDDGTGLSYMLPTMTAGAVGNLYGSYRGYRAPIERAEEAIAARRGKHQKVAGLFMRPSDVADHKNLAAALESKLNGAGQGSQFKLAAAPSERLVKAAALSADAINRIVDGGIGAAGGLIATNRLMNRTLSETTGIPSPQQPAGAVDRARAAYSRALDDASQIAKNHPVTSYLLGGAAGAVGGATSGARVYDRLNTLLRR